MTIERPFFPPPLRATAEAVGASLLARPPSALRSPKRIHSHPTLDVATFPDQYAMICEGDCMSPVIRDGAVVAVSKVERPVQGDYVAIWIRPEFVKPGEHQVIVKRLALNVPHMVKSFPFDDHPESDVMAMLMLERFRPANRIVVPCNVVLALHKAIGLFPASKVGGSHAVDTLRPFPAHPGKAVES